MQYRVVEVNGLVFEVWFNYTKARNQSTGSMDNRLPDIEEEIEIIDVVTTEASEQEIKAALLAMLHGEI